MKAKYTYFYSYMSNKITGMGSMNFTQKINKKNLWESIKIIQKGIAKINKDDYKNIIILNFQLIK